MTDPLSRSLFVTGTDTHVGKTFVSQLLLRHWRKQGIDAVGFKPFCCGERSDAELLLAAADHCLDLNSVNPVWLRPPAAPYTAALIENRPLDLDLVRETFRRLCQDHSRILVEGAGGWRVPITHNYSISDLAAELGLPVLVVAANRLGALNHTLLTVESILAAGLECAGVVLNAVTADAPRDDAIAVATNRAVLESLLPVPLLSEIQYQQELWNPPSPFGTSSEKDAACS
jgi:dethiobiotin synthetase